VIAVITDYGTRDFYAGVLEGSILRIDPEAHISTITHEVEPFDIREGSYLLAQAAPAYPAGTVFVTIVDPGVGTARRPVVLRATDGTLFVGPDNGLFTKVMHVMDISSAYEITNGELVRPESATFHGRDIFGPIAAHLGRGLDPAAVGPSFDPATLVRLDETAPAVRGDTLTGEVVHVDRYGNLISNIPAAMAASLHARDEFTMVVGNVAFPVRVGMTYGDVRERELVVLVNAEGVVEVAANMASASSLCGVRAGDQVSLAPAMSSPETPAAG
jgi:hypothetical protein